jgi:hypothetical protein
MDIPLTLLSSASSYVMRDSLYDAVRWGQQALSVARHHLDVDGRAAEKHADLGSVLERFEHLVRHIEKKFGPLVLRQCVTSSNASRFKNIRHIKFTIFRRSIVSKAF